MRLWATRNPPLRFFLVPDDQQLPSGPVVVESTATQLAHVEPSAMVAWEISVREARKWFQANTGAIDAERAAASKKAQAAMAAATKALGSFLDSPELNEVMLAVGLDPARIMGDIEGSGQMMEALTALLGEPLPDDERACRVRKIMRRFGHIDANRALRREPASVERLMAALEAALDPQRS